MNVLTPQMTERELAEIPIVEAEQPGMGKALGAAVGLAGGMGVAEVALSSLVAPGIGPVLGIGLLSGILLAAIGAVTAVRLKTTWYMFARRRTARLRGRAAPRLENHAHENIARGVFEAAGAETIDRARDIWWLGLRDGSTGTASYCVDETGVVRVNRAGAVIPAPCSTSGFRPLQ